MGIVAKIIPAISLREQFATRITDGYKRIYRDILAIGGMLVEARKELPYGEFQRMIDADLPFSQRTAYNYIREWTIANSEDVQPVARLNPAYSVRAEIDRLTDDEVRRGVDEGKLYQGVPRADVIEFRKTVRAEHQHRPEAARTTPAPYRPAGEGASTYSELIWLLIEWRNVLNIPQASLDELVGWGEGQTSKYEIPHTDDGRKATIEALFDWLNGLKIGIKLVPIT